MRRPWCLASPRPPPSPRPGAPLLCLQAVLDAYLCLVHLTLGIMVESLFHSFGAVAFMQFGEQGGAMFARHAAVQPS